MANQYQNATLTEKVMQHGEMLVRLTTIVDRHDKKLDEQDESIDVIAKAVARQQMRSEFWDKFVKIVLPIATTIAGVIAGHFIR